MLRVAILGVLAALASGCGNKDDIPTPPVHIGMGSSAGAATGGSGGSAGATTPSSGSVTPSSGTLVSGMTSGSSGSADGG